MFRCRGAVVCSEQMRRCADVQNCRCAGGLEVQTVQEMKEMQV